MKEEMLKRINSVGKVGEILCKICGIFCLIAAIACLVGGILLSFVPRNAVTVDLKSSNTAVINIDSDYDLSKILDLGDLSASIEIDGNKFFVTDNGEPITYQTTFHVSDIKWMLFVCVACCIALYIVFKFAGKMCASFKKCDTPFCEAVSRSMICFAWSLLPLAIMSSIVSAVAEGVFTGSLDFTVNVDLTAALLILAVFMLSYIFKYGAALQQESDETL